MVEYSLDLQNINLSAIRTVRVLRPLKAINRVPSELAPLPHPWPSQTPLYPVRSSAMPVLGTCPLSDQTDVGPAPTGSCIGSWA